MHSAHTLQSQMSEAPTWSRKTRSIRYKKKVNDRFVLLFQLLFLCGSYATLSDWSARATDEHSKWMLCVCVRARVASIECAEARKKCKNYYGKLLIVADLRIVSSWLVNKWSAFTVSQSHICVVVGFIITIVRFIIWINHITTRYRQHTWIPIVKNSSFSLLLSLHCKYFSRFALLLSSIQERKCSNWWSVGNLLGLLYFLLPLLDLRSR